MPAAAQRNNCHSLDAVEISRRKRGTHCRMDDLLGRKLVQTSPKRTSLFFCWRSPSNRPNSTRIWINEKLLDGGKKFARPFFPRVFFLLASALPQSSPAPPPTPPSYPFLWNENVGCHFTPFSKHAKRADKIEQKSKQQRQDTTRPHKKQNQLVLQCTYNRTNKVTI